MEPMEPPLDPPLIVSASFRIYRNSGELSMLKQCIPGSLFPPPHGCSQEPGSQGSCPALPFVHERGAWE